MLSRFDAECFHGRLKAEIVEMSEGVISEEIKSQEFVFRETILL